MAEVARKLAALESGVADLGSAVVCFSGGVDSTFLLRVAHDVLGDRCVALTAVSPAVPQREVDSSRRLAAEIGARHLIVESHELDRRDFAANASDRCFHCKTELMSVAGPKARELGIEHVCLGTNLDDLGDHRPGLAAAKQFGARHPLVDAGLGKDDIRTLSRELGLSTWNKPQMACLSSRIPYGTPVTVERLGRVEEFENALQDLGFGQLRVRFHGTIARVELDSAELEKALQVRERIVEVGRDLGFTYVTLDLAAFRTGAMNEVLESSRRSPAGVKRLGDSQ